MSTTRFHTWVVRSVAALGALIAGVFMVAHAPAARAARVSNLIAVDSQPAVVTRVRHLLATDSATTAERIMKEALAANENNSAYHLWMGAVYSQLGARSFGLGQWFYVGRVRRELERAVALDGTSVDAHSELARFYLTAPTLLGGSYTRAEGEAKAVADRSPGRYHGLLGFIAHHKGDVATAERELRAAVAAAPDSAWGYAGLASLLVEQQRNDEAFAMWQRAAQLDSSFIDAYRQMGLIGATTGTHLADAGSALEYYLAHPPRPKDLRGRALASSKLGLIYEKQGRLADAKRAYQQAVTWSPGNAAYQQSLKRVS